MELKDSHNLILNNVSRFIELTDLEKHRFISLLKEITIKKKNFLLQEGDVAKYEYFITKNGIPSLVDELSKVFEKADGFVISLAEHNGSYSAVFKNIMDWLSRINTEFWNQKPMFLMTTSPGKRGGANVLQSALTSFPFLGAVIIESFALPSFYQNFSNGKITDHSFRNEHQRKVANFLKAINPSFTTVE